MTQPPVNSGDDESEEIVDPIPDLPLPEDVVPGTPLTPGAACRRLALEMRKLREAAGLTLQHAGDAIERSPATISRFEANRYMPREVEVRALLGYFDKAKPGLVDAETEDRILWLRTEGRKEQWYESFKQELTGDMIPAHIQKFVEYETDAEQIRSYESDRVPGLLQTFGYARAVAEIFFPDRRAAEYERFAAFRLARQAKLREPGRNLRSTFIVNEVALRRELGSPDVLREQLEALVSGIEREGAGHVDLRIVPITTATPAAMDGPFVIMSFPNGSQDGELVYLESRTGGSYLTAEADVQRFVRHFENLTSVARSGADAVRLIRSILDGPSG